MDDARTNVETIDLNTVHEILVSLDKWFESRGSALTRISIDYDLNVEVAGAVIDRGPIDGSISVSFLPGDGGLVQQVEAAAEERGLFLVSMDGSGVEARMCFTIMPRGHAS